MSRAVEDDAAGGRPVRAGDRAQERRLAGAVRADERDRLALGDLERDAAHGRQQPVAGLDPLELRAGRSCAHAARGTRRRRRRPASPRRARRRRSPGRASRQTSRSTTCTSTWTMCSIQTIATPARADARGSSRRARRPRRRSARRRSRRAAARPGSVPSARASSSFLRSSRPRLSARRFATSTSPQSSSTSMQRAYAAWPRAARRRSRADEDVLEHRQVAERPRHLVRAPDPEPAALADAGPRDVRAAERRPTPPTGEARPRGRSAASSCRRRWGRRCRRHRRPPPRNPPRPGRRARRSACGSRLRQGSVPFRSHRRSNLRVVRLQLRLDRDVVVVGVLAEDPLELELARSSP